MLLTSALLFLAAGPLQQREADVPVAVTRSGVAVECTAETKKGDMRIHTPYGSFDSPGDPVEEIRDAGATVRALQPLLTDESEWNHWLQRVSAEGLLTELVEGGNSILDKDPGRPSVYEALAQWGLEIEPAPSALPYDQYVPWMWARVLSSSPATGTLAAARLAAAVAPGENVASPQQVSLSDLQKALKDRRAHVRWAAARVAAQQSPFQLLRVLMLLSVEDPAHAVRNAAAAAAAAIHAHDARQYWTLCLARGTAGVRVQAAENLGACGGPQAVEPLMVVLYASTQSRTGNYELEGQVIQVVRDRRLRIDTGGLDGNPGNVHVLERGSVFKVTVVEEAVKKALLAALDRWNGEESGRDAAAWLSWYREDRKTDGS